MNSRNLFWDPTDVHRERVRIEWNINSLEEQIKRLSEKEVDQKESLSNQIAELKVSLAELIAKNNANIAANAPQHTRAEKNRDLLRALMSHPTDLTIWWSRWHKPTEYERTIWE